MKIKRFFVDSDIPIQAKVYAIYLLIIVFLAIVGLVITILNLIYRG